jgi:regulator of CtrA degradation
MRPGGGIGALRPEGLHVSDGGQKSGGGETIAFGRRFAEADTFRALFRDGMALVEETATYLDTDGRADSKRLGRAGSLTYATESMRLTTRLMQLASWLLLQRAVNDGELTPEQAREEKAKVRLKGLDTVMEGPGWTDLPQQLKELISRSLRLQERIRRLDESLVLPAAAADNPVARALGQINEAFGSARK